MTASQIAPLRIRPLRAGGWVLLPGALGFAALSLGLGEPVLRLIAALVASTLVALAIALHLQGALAARARRQRDRTIVGLVVNDDAACFLTDAQGQVIFRNAAAADRFGGQDQDSLTGLLADHFASPGAVLYRLQTRALGGFKAREDVVTRAGHSRISARAAGPDRVIWRLEEFQDRTGAGRGADQLGLPMLTANRQGVVLYSNEAMRRLLGSRPRHLDALFGGGPRKSGEEVEIATATGPVRALLAEIEGSGVRHEIYLLPVSAGDRSARGLTDFENFMIPLAKFGAGGQLIGANLVARGLLALEGEDEQTQFRDLFEGLGRPVTDWLGDVLAERLPASSEVLRARRMPGEAFFQISLRRVVESGRPYVLAVLQDATQFKRLEGQFFQSQKMQAIGQLAGGIAHDFNNLLTAISGHCDLLLTRHSREHTDFSDLMQIHQNANRAAALVGQLLAFSRKQTLNLEAFDLQDALSDLTHLLNRLVGERASLRFVHDSRLRALRADRRQLEQVIMNLVVNARDAMPEGGTILIETEALHLPVPLERDRAVVPAGDWAVVRVADTGIGIPPELLEKIFEPFFTTKKLGEGTGLGLSTAYGIIKQSGGFIFVDSKLGGGTVFTLFFPIADLTERQAQGTPAEAAPTRAAEGRLGEGVVLLVEDEAPVRAFAARALRMRGYTVLEAASAEEALALLKDPGLKVDIFVTDVVMPGLDGPGWVREALIDRPGVKVVFVSGYSEDTLQEDQSLIPNSVFLPKPFSLMELTRTVQGQLH
ncbi:MAG: ATP-binding protein [Paracoccaceae bacterium]